MEKIMVYILVTMWACTLGIIEARADDSAKKPDKYKHYYYSLSRLIIYIIIYVLSYDLIFTLSTLLLFCWWHDGFYYISRNKLAAPMYKPYPNGWFDKGKTAWFDKFMNWKVRLILFIVSLGLIYLCLHKYLIVLIIGLL